ncbi:hypothetical protein D3C84_1186100 [compost metagenome]
MEHIKITAIMNGHTTLIISLAFGNGRNDKCLRKADKSNYKNLPIGENRGIVALTLYS